MNEIVEMEVMNQVHAQLDIVELEHSNVETQIAHLQQQFAMVNKLKINNLYIQRQNY